MCKLKDFLCIFLLIICITLVLSPSLSLLLYEKTFNDFGLVIDNFGHFSNHIKFTNAPISYYFSSYGTLIAAVALAYKAFEFNSQSYYTLALILRIFAAFSIYYFVIRWTKSRIAGFISGLFFGISFAGIQNTLWVTLSSVYLEIVFIFIFLNKWWTFHINPTKKTAFYSILTFLLAIFAYPARASGLILTIFAVELFLIFRNLKNFKIPSLKLKHSFVLFFIVCILVFGLKTLSKTPDIEFKMISPKILSYSLLTGYPPLVTTFWLFLSNLIISPYTIAFISNSKIFLELIINLLPLIGSVYLLSLLIKKRFFLAFSILPAITFPLFIFGSERFLKNWPPDWILVTQFGGSMFLWATWIIIFFIWNKNRRLAIIGLLGILIIVSYLLMPWMISTQPSGDDQSAFDFTHRYYTLSTVGMGLFLASIFTFFIQVISENIPKTITKMKQKIQPLSLFKAVSINGAFLSVPTLIISLIILHSTTTYAYLAEKSKDLDTKSFDILWTKIKPVFKENQRGKTQFVYLEYKERLDEPFIQYFFPARAAIYLGQTRNPPKIKFIFNKKDLKKIDLNNFYAFRFDGKNLFDIKDQIIKSLN